ncbi:MAG TPA: hypothetical protein VMM82_03025, partial [Spirochaetia bacterium]|nr:hypothetical protein [Spirochaetia bacterium]
GLKDIDLTLTLARVKLQACLAMMKSGRSRSSGQFENLAVSIGRRAASAIRLVETLASENISEDQKGVVQASPLFSRVRGLLEEFVVAGGAGFLQPVSLNQHATDLLSRIVATSIRKYMGEDDRYPPLDVERFPPIIQKLLLALFPVFIRLRPQKPPYGIEEGEELTYRSPAMRLPLSQAIAYVEEELVPGLERRLAGEPGDPALQEELGKVRAHLQEYRSLRVTPRAAPVLPLARGLYTEGMTAFTQDGEILVSIPVAVSFKSGTNLDRTMELVRMDVVRRVAGRGLSPEIDREYRRLRSLESGIRGSSRTPSFKLDPSWGSWVLRRDFPFLGRLSDKKGFQELARVVRSGSLRAAQGFIAALIARDSNTPLAAGSGEQGRGPRENAEAGK